MRTLLASLLTAGLLSAVPAADVPPGPPVTITLGPRHGHATPVRPGFIHSGGGNIDVTQPAPDTVVVTMTGATVAGGHPCEDSAAAFQFDLDQCLELTINDPNVRKAKLSLEGRVIGLLRSYSKGGGSAEPGPGIAAVSCGPAEILVLTMPPHSVASGENLSVNCREGPVVVPVVPGKYELHEKWGITAAHPRTIKLCKASSAEFASDPTLDPLWISCWEPFHGAAKKDFGFQVILKVAPDPETKGDTGKQ